MAKTSLTEFTSLANETSFLLALNNNFEAISNQLDLFLSRDGEPPNTMQANIDMNSNRIYNLGAPTQASDALRKQDLDELGLITNDELLEIIGRLDSLDEYEVTVAELADDAQDSANAAAASAALSASYVGAVTSAPTWTTPRDFTFTGDATGGPVSVDGSANETFPLTIANSAVTNAKLATVATQTIKGRTTSGTGAVEDLTVAQVLALLPNLVGDSGSGGTRGIVPAPEAGDAGAAKFLSADGTWKTISTGDVDLSSVDASVQTLSSTNGSIKLGDIILKWGFLSASSSAAGYTYLTFDTPFPNECYAIYPVARNTNISPTTQTAVWQVAGFNIYTATLYRPTANGSTLPACYWFAIGS